MNRTFYIDGSCNNRSQGTLPRVGGVGIIEVFEDSIICYSYGPYKDVTSARMEVLGLLLCLRMIDTPNTFVTIYCDNQYVVNAREKGWCFRWVSNEEERPNIDLWEEIVRELKKLVNHSVFVKLEWVRGHSGSKYNELADKYANRGRHGEKLIDIIKDE